MPSSIQQIDVDWRKSLQLSFQLLSSQAIVGRKHPQKLVSQCSTAGLAAPSGALFIKRHLRS